MFKYEKVTVLLAVIFAGVLFIGCDADDPVIKPKIKITDKQLQKKFKHAVDFGITGNPNRENLDKFKDAILNHCGSPNVKVISGTYRGDPVTHYCNENTGVNVISNGDGDFVSGWKLSPRQLEHVLDHGGLGGG
jgi:hypothetical protein